MNVAASLYRLCVACLSMTLCIGPAGGQDIENTKKPTLFHIDEGPLESAIIQFSRQADVQIILAPESPADVVVSAVHGRFTVQDALAALLKGTGFVYTMVGNTFTVTLPKPTAASSRADMVKSL